MKSICESDKAIETSISVCIVNWNTKDFLYECLTSITPYQQPEKLEIIVVDNHSDDGSAEMTREKFHSVRLVANQDNRGYAAANNQAIEIAQGEYILLLNPDTRIPANIFPVLKRKMEQDPSIGLITCQLRNFDGSVQGFCSGLPTLADEIFLQTGFDQLYPDNPVAAHRTMTYFDYESEAEIEQPPGTFMFLRRQVLETVEGFDEQFRIFFNDVDLCKRIRDAGWKVLYTPDVYIYHHKSASIKKNLAQHLTDAFYMRRIYYRKHYGAFRQRLLSFFAPFPNTGKASYILPASPGIKSILFVRSSFDAHFAESLELVRKSYPDTRIDLLTTRYPDTENPELCSIFRRIHLYNGKRRKIYYSLTNSLLKKTLKNQQYDVVFFPHAAVDGAGYWNIIFFALALSARFIVGHGVDKRLNRVYPHLFFQFKYIFVYLSAHLLLFIKSRQ
ncbi:MAG: glycosyltransferase [Candidatus Auribacterota bacterium]